MIRSPSLARADFEQLRVGLGDLDVHVARESVRDRVDAHADRAHGAQ